MQIFVILYLQTRVLLSLDSSFFENTVDPDQLASEGSTMFSILIENTCFNNENTAGLQVKFGGGGVHKSIQLDKG